MSRQSSGRTNRRYVGLSLAIGLTVALCSRVVAQTVFYACYTDKTGVIYLIDPTGKDPNLPSECAKSGKHIQFGWVDGKGAEHAGLSGLRGDDHPQYLPTDGSRPVTGDLIARTKVGIGVTTASAPLTLLPVDGADIEFASGTGDNADIYARNAFNIGTIGSDLHPLSLVTQGQYRLYVTGDGKVGIGTITPGQQLSVAGTVESTTGGFKFPDGTVQTSAAASGAPAILADGVTSTTDGFAVTGTYHTGSLPADGPGVRVMWYPAKAAFRAGRVIGSQWDDTEIGQYSIAMGYSTTASDEAATALGWFARASGYLSTAIGANTEASGVASVAIGESTRATGDISIALGQSTIASSGAATAIGYRTEASDLASTAMGNKTVASGQYSTSMGSETKASGRIATAMGEHTVADADNSTAIGAFASTNGFEGAFVYGDASTVSTGGVVNAGADNSFVVRASGGVAFYTNSTLSAGVGVPAGGGSWANLSDRNRKHLFRDISGESVLAEIAAMPIQSWSYRSQDASIRHVGPTAQDFFSAFGLGSSELTITTSDISGINMLAIQALERRTRELAEARAKLDELESRLAALEATLNGRKTTPLNR